jgi:hypothetical protein
LPLLDKINRIIRPEEKLENTIYHWQSNYISLSSGKGNIDFVNPENPVGKIL